MKDPATIRFVSSNYLFLQGLRLIPVGLVSLFLAAWTNSNRTFAQDGDFLLWCYVLAIGGYFLVGRYYQRTFGITRMPFTQALLLLGAMLVASLLGWWTFRLDQIHALPVSTFGIFLAIVLAVDYVRMTWEVRGRYLKIQPVFAVVIFTLSVLPLLGWEDWWNWLGLRSAHLAILLIISLFMLIEGWVSHRLLVRLLGPA